MKIEDLEGSEILEKLAAIGKVDDFFEAVDLDDFKKAASLMRKANIDADNIAEVLKQMSESNGEK